MAEYESIEPGKWDRGSAGATVLRRGRLPGIGGELVEGRFGLCIATLYGLAVATAVLAALLKVLLVPLTQEESPSLLFFFAILLCLVGTELLVAAGRHKGDRNG